jgi:hypothetical protein
MSLNRYVRVVNGEECFSAEAVGILCGKTAEEIKAESERQGTEHFQVPKSWLRGAKEVQARYGTDNAAEILARVMAERCET